MFIISRVQKEGKIGGYRSNDQVTNGRVFPSHATRRYSRERIDANVQQARPRGRTRGRYMTRVLRRNSLYDAAGRIQRRRPAYLHTFTPTMFRLHRARYLPP